MPIGTELHRRVALEDPEGNWQLICRRLSGKQERSEVHRRIIADLHHQLRMALPADAEIFVDGVYLPSGSEHRLIPDVAVAPLEVVGSASDLLGGKPAIGEPVVLVVELWSPDIDGHDFDTKIWQYQARGDREIWSVHPIDRILTAWRRKPDGTYSEQVYREGVVTLASLPNLSISLAELFA